MNEYGDKMLQVIPFSESGNTRHGTSSMTLSLSYLVRSPYFMPFTQ